MSLVKIYNDTHSICFYDNAAVKVLYKSPFFQTENEIPVKSYSFKIPAKENQDFFKFANLLDNRNGVYMYEVNIDIAGSFQGAGLLLVEQFSKEEFSIKFTLDRGAYALALNKNIREFSFIKTSPYRYRTSAGLPNISYKDFEFTFVAGVPEEGNIPVDTIVELWSSKLNREIIFNVTYTPPQTMASYIDSIVAAINLNTAEHCILSKNQSAGVIRIWDLANNDNYAELSFVPATFDWFEYFNNVNNISSSHPDPVLAEFEHANETVANPSNYDYVYYPVLTSNVALAGFDFKQVVNHYYPAAVAPGPSFNGKDNNSGTQWVRDNLLMPYAYLWDVLQMIFKEINVEVKNDFFDAELKTLTLFTPMYTNLFKNNISGGLVTRNFLYSSILPDIKFGKLLNELKTMFGMISEFNSKDESVRFVSRKSIIKSTDVDDWSEKVLYEYDAQREPIQYAYKTNWPNDEEFADTRIINNTRLQVLPMVDVIASLTTGIMNDYRLVYSLNYYYRKYSDFGSNGWQFYNEGLENYTPDGFTDEINCDISTLFLANTETDYTTTGKKVKWLLPWTSQPFYRHDAQKDKVDVQLLFYRGLRGCLVQEGVSLTPTTPRTYPFASYHNYDVNGTRIGEYNLSWNHPDGLINQWHIDFLSMMLKGIPVYFDMELSILEINNLNLLRKKRINNQEYLIDEIEVTYTDKISIARVKCYPMKNPFNE